MNLPRVPVQLPSGVDETVSGVTQRLDPRNPAHLRLIRVRDLLRQHRDELEPDPAGAPALRSEILAFAPSDAALEHAQAAGFTILRTTTLEGLGARIVVLHSPPRTSTRRALKRLQKLDPAGTYDYNHIYTETGEFDAPDAGKPTSAVAPGPPPADAPPQAAENRVRIGLVDGGVDGTHAVFADALVHSYGCKGTVVPNPHGTAVASLLVGRSRTFQGAAPGAELFAADVYCGRPFGGSVDAVADALAWMTREQVPVINVSLVGPRNVALAGVVGALVSRGYIIVAAVGNDGPAAGPLYPASYPGVVGVTGVDAKQQVLIEACRGPQVDFAAPGADMAAAVPAQAYAAVRGTSFASPIVAGLIAAQRPSLDPKGEEAAVALLAVSAKDLGDRGLDVIYGNGLVGQQLRVDLAAANGQP